MNIKSFYLPQLHNYVRYNAWRDLLSFAGACLFSLPAKRSVAVVIAMAGIGIGTIACRKDDPNKNEEPEDAGVTEVSCNDLPATDALGRKLPEYAETGDFRPNKFVGLFYWTWHNSVSSGRPACNVSEIIAAHPEAKYDFDHPAWPHDGYFFWGEPLFGYYSNTDRWVLRRHAEMLADAGVDVIIFDCTNGSYTWRESYMALCEVFSEARQDGVKTPQIAFMLAFNAGDDRRVAIEEIYRDLYTPGVYKDLFFLWKGKPLIMAYPENLSEEIRNYFTFRPGQPVYNQGPTREDHWGWLEIYPQHGYIDVVSTAAKYEQATVGVAQNWSTEKGLTAMNAPDVFGRSHTVKPNPAASAPDAVNYGYNFQEQWDRALELNPQFIFITGWNEWVAGRHREWGGVSNAFPDQFDQEASRDVEPMKGGHGDNYYCQMVSNIRRFKGMSKPATPSKAKTIVIDGAFDDWDNVSPKYLAHKGSAIHRDSPGWKDLHYTNSTGRNDFVSAKVARDSEYIYFYAATAKDITPSTDAAWMRLFINTDRNYATGWEGYDFVINRQNPQAKAIVEKSLGGWNWQKTGEIDFRVTGAELELSIPRSLLGLENTPLDVEFKWNDNMQENGNIMDFYVNGDTAPGGRFNYVFTE
ncbi:MAG: hypothetical protein LBF89_04640 [Bacteroidales bacterium]|jgi:hypothetical protein|nr:hypothetical protein [Bacteroidales bacterium]